MKKTIIAIVFIFFVLIVILLFGVFLGIEYYALRDQEKIINEKELIEGLSTTKEYNSVLDHELAVINVVEESAPAVVNIVASKYVTTRRHRLEDFFYRTEEEYENELRERIETGEGTGFIISSSGIIITNRHVVLDEKAEYKVFLSNGKKYDAEILARDPVYDLAVLKIEGEGFNTIKIGDSDSIRIGQTAIAIGNALGEFHNTVSVGVISGVGRRIIAQGGPMIDILDDVIQTDAAINLGNSGGPLLNLNGQVIGINTAMAVRAEGIGFAIPINKVKRAIEGVLSDGSITYPFLGVRYIIIDDIVQKENDLEVNYGALLVSGQPGESAIEKGTGAHRAGLQEADIILKIDDKKISTENPLGRIIMEYYPQDEIELLILRQGKEKRIKAVLGKM